MPKVVTSAGLENFVLKGKTEEMRPEVKAPVVAADPPEVKTAPKEPEDEAIDGDDIKTDGMSDALKDAIAKKNATINRKHREMKEAKEAAEEAERFAESQFNERRLIESERDTLKRELEELRGRAEPKVDEPKPPKKEDPQFLNDKGEFQWDKFTDAQAEFKLEQFKREQAREQQQRDQAALDALIAQRVEKAKEKYPDFVEVVGAQDRKDVPGFIMQYLRESELGPDMAYYFAKNREELTKIAKLSPILALARLGRLEVRLEPTETKPEPKPVKVSQAPPPITPISTSSAGTVVTDPSKMDYKQLRAYRREQERAKRRG